MCNWGYGRTNGPHTWSIVFPAAKGNFQSPINISTKHCSYFLSSEDQPLNVDLSSVKIRNIVNTGHNFQVDVDSIYCGCVAKSSGGPLRKNYKPEEFHFHWGRNDYFGSEHTIDNETFPCELHIVYIAEDYSSFSEAACFKDGLAVLGVLIQVGNTHKEMDKLIDLLPHISFKDENIAFEGEFDFMSLLPASKAYWTYYGSLTTPPCHESVNWIVFEEPITFSSDQIAVFRGLHSYRKSIKCPIDEFGGRILENYRPSQSISNRIVRYCKF